jgi:hypothetical protein
MTPDDLEARTKPELIDLILRQQLQIADLQSQLVQAQSALKPNGADTEFADAAGGPQMGRFPGALKLVLIAAGLLVCGIGLLVANFKPGVQVSVGSTRDFAPGTVTAIQLPPPNRGEQPIPILIVNDPSAGFLALHGRDPGSNCLLTWVAAAQRIEDPCSGSTYTATGVSLERSAEHRLNRFPVVVSENGEITVDIGTLQTGSPP